MSSETYYINVIVLKFRTKENQWNMRPRQVYQSSSGRILAMEHDKDYPNETESYWTNGNSLEIDKEVINQLFVLDSMLFVTKLRQT